MRIYSLVAAAALLSASLAAHADTITVNFTVNGSTLNGQGHPITSTGFNQFSPLLGTLNSFDVSLSGKATYGGGGVDDLIGVDVAPGGDGLSGHASGFISREAGTFAISFSGHETDPFYLSTFTGTGSEALTLIFGDQTSNVSVTNGMVTYNYTPAIAATPEPSSLILLGTGALGMIGAARRKFRNA